MKNARAFSRRDLLKSGGALVVSFALGSALPGHASAQSAPPAQGNAPGGRGGPPSAPELDSFLAIHPDGKVTLFTSHVDVGTGILTAYRQIAAEELGIPVERFSVVEGDTATTPDHGGTGGSSGVPRGGVDIRRAAATARRALLDLGSKELSRPASELTIRDAQVCPLNGGPGVNIAALIGGKHFAMN